MLDEFPKLLEGWKKGSPLLARKLQAMSDAINRIRNNTGFTQNTKVAHRTQERFLRFRQEDGSMPTNGEEFSPYRAKGYYKIIEVDIHRNGTGAFDARLTIDGTEQGDTVDENTTYPFKLTTPVLWEKGEDVGLKMKSEPGDFTDFEAVYTCLIIKE